jgi:hypothetical protein
LRALLLLVLYPRPNARFVRCAYRAPARHTQAVSLYVPGLPPLCKRCHAQYAPDRAVRAAVQQLRVRCRFSLRAACGDNGGSSGSCDAAWVPDDHGCRAVLPLAEVAAHEAACPFELLSCRHVLRSSAWQQPINGCGARFRRADAAAHDAACPLLPRPCGVDGCAVLLPPGALLHALALGRATDAERVLVALVADAYIHDGLCAHAAGYLQQLALQRMAAEAADAAVQRAGCAALAALFVRVAGDAPLDVARALGALQAALRAHPAHRGVQRHACVALGSLAGWRGAGAAGLVTILLATVRAHRADADIVEAACMALRGVFKPRDNRACAISSGAVAALLAAMREHGAHAALQTQACLALRNIFALPENEACAASVGAIAAAVSALRTHGTCADVAAAACAALQRMTAATEGNRASAGAAGAIELVLDAMWAHDTRDALLIDACGVLRALCACSAGLRGRARAAGAARTLQAVLAACTDSKGPFRKSGTLATAAQAALKTLFAV